VSFILDALRKSESQRRLDAVPGLMRVPVAMPRDRLPVWAVGVIATLAVALVAAIGVGWRNRVGPTPPTSTVEGPQTEVPPVASEPPRTSVSVPERAGAGIEPSLATAARPPAVSPEPPVQREAAASRPAPVGLPAPSAAARAAVPIDSGGPNTPPPSQARIEPSSLPSAEALRASGISIPALDLQLLVTSTTPARRLVVINGNRYREGERLREGPELVEISAAGAVLKQGGAEFLLVTD
jgi:general secretion pathway protein B